MFRFIVQKPFRLYGILALLGCSSATLTAAVLRLTPVLDLGAPFSSLPGVSMTVDRVSLSRNGHVLGTGTLRGTDVTLENNEVLFLVPPGGDPQIVLRESTLISDPLLPADARWGQVIEMQVDDAGSIALLAKLDHGVDEVLHVVLRGTPGTLKAIAHVGQALGEGFIWSLDSVQLSASGWFAFGAGGMIFGEALSLENLLIDLEVPYPGMATGSVFTGTYSPFLVNDSAEILFRGYELAGDGSRPQGLWVLSGEAVERVLGNGDSAPDLTGTTVGLSYNKNYLEFADAGWVAVKARNSGSADGVYDGQALYGGIPGAIHAIVYPGMATPGIEGGTFGTVFYLEGLSEEGDVLFRSQVNLPQGGSPDSLWVWSPEKLHLIAFEGQIAPGFADLAFDRLELAMGIDRQGRTVFQTWVGGIGVTSALYRETADGVLEWLLGEGDSVIVGDRPPLVLQSANFLVPTWGKRFDGSGRFLARTVSSDNASEIVWVEEIEELPPIPASIFGTLRADNDESGDLSEGDPGLGAVRIDLYEDDGTEEPAGDLVATTISAADGTFSFADLMPRDYVLIERNEWGYVPVGASEGTPRGRVQVALASGVDSIGQTILIGHPTEMEVSFSLHQVTPAFVTNLEDGRMDIDRPLEPVADPTLLEQTPGVLMGLVADGVTPLLIRLHASGEGIPENRKLELKVTQVLYGSVWDGLENHLRISQDGAWNETERTFVLPSDATRGTWAMVSPIPFDQLLLAEGKTEVLAHLQVTDGLTQRVVGDLIFALRRPPVALIHGYNTQGDWNLRKHFNTVGLKRPVTEDEDNFVLTIRYGQNLARNQTMLPVVEDAVRENTAYNLAYLARMLQVELDTAFHNLHARWAFTRHDVIAHSQGGLLVRFLCAENPPRYGGLMPPPAVRPFQSVENSYRGRFHRIITVGSPHNGSRLVHYLNAMWWRVGDYNLFSNLTTFLAMTGYQLGVIRDKFDPAGVEIRALNDPSPEAFWKPDPDARFHLVQTVINDGFAPSAQRHTNADWWLNLDTVLGANVLPYGSDGVVDFESMGAQSPGEPPAPNVYAIPPGYTISHSGPEDMFSREGGPMAEGQTASLTVGLHLADALERNPLVPLADIVFGPFPLPRRLDETDLKPIRDAAAIFNWWRITPTVFPLRMRTARMTGDPGAMSLRNEAVPALSFTVQLNPPEDLPLQGAVSWTLLRYGPEGAEVLEDGLTPDPADATAVAVELLDPGPGEYVVVGAYGTSDDSRVLSEPVTLAVIAPQGAVPVTLHLAVEPARPRPGDFIEPRLAVAYSDGTVLAKSPFDLVFEASDAAIVDVSGGTLWRSTATGRCTVSVAHAGLTAAVEIEVLDPAQRGAETYEAWRAAFFDAAERADPAISGLAANPDGDAEQNAFEFLFGRHPRVLEPGRPMRMERITVDGGLYPAIHLQLRQSLGEMILVLERSEDLDTWTEFFRLGADPATELASPLLAGTLFSPEINHLTIRGEVPIDPSASLPFFRFRVE